MGIFDTINNLIFGTERVKASKAECKTKKEKAKTDYDAVMKQIEAECEASLTKAKEADKVAVPPITEPTFEPSSGFSSSEKSPIEPNKIGGKKGGKSKKRSKGNRKKTRKH